MGQMNPAATALRAELLGQLESGLRILPDKDEETVPNTLAALWHAAAGQPMSEVLAERTPLPEITTAQMERLRGLITRRLSGVPLAQLTGRKRFVDIEYIVNDGIYIPRRETELLANTCIALLSEQCSGQSEAVVMDLCTGIGALALAVARYVPNVRVYASDLLNESVANANLNAEFLGLAGRVEFFCGDLFKPYEQLGLQGRVALVLSAPPYISSAKVQSLPQEIAKHEPEAAFNAGPFGLSIFNELISTAPRYLRRAGYLALEVGLGQGPFLKERILKNPAYNAVREVLDEQGNLRVLVAQTKE